VNSIMMGNNLKVIFLVMLLVSGSWARDDDGWTFGYDSSQSCSSMIMMKQFLSKSLADVSPY